MPWGCFNAIARRVRMVSWLLGGTALNPYPISGKVTPHHAMRKASEKPITVPSASSEAGTSNEVRVDAAILDQLFSAAYEELRRLAAAVRRSDPGATLNPTSLVNEAWVKLSASQGLAFTSHLHFKRVAARAMRQVLIESARRRHASKRGNDVRLVTFTESLDEGIDTSRELLALDDALDALARISPRQAQMVEGRFFGGFEIPEIAEILGVSEATVQRDWRASKAWLARELRRERHADRG